MTAVTAAQSIRIWSIIQNALDRDADLRARWNNPAYQQQPEDCPGSPQPISGIAGAENLTGVTAQTPAALVPVGARDGNGGGE